MKLTDQELKAVWQESTRPAGVLRGDCLSDELLMRAGLNELSEAERQQIASHLMNCADCSQEYGIARAANLWARETAAEHSSPVIQPVTVHPDRRLSFWAFAGFKPLTAAIAAALLIAATILGFWTARLLSETRNLHAKLSEQQAETNRLATQQATQTQQNTEQFVARNQSLTEENARLAEELNALRKPQLETPIVDVDPASLTRGTAGAGKEAVTKIDVPATAALFTIILHLNGEQNYPALLIELIDRKTNKVLWSEQQKRIASPNLTLTLAKSNSPAGSYRIRISGVNGQRKTLLDHYDIQVNYLGK
jgi:hypothetical protein